MNENWRNVGRARVAQIERVNGEAREMPAEAHNLVRPVVSFGSVPTRDENAVRLRCEALEAQLAEAHAAIADLRAQLDSRGLTYNSRPVLTSKQAAEALGRTLSTVSRYCASGHLAHVRVNGELFIYSDQPLAPKERKRK